MESAGAEVLEVLEVERVLPSPRTLTSAIHVCVKD